MLSSSSIFSVSVSDSFRLTVVAKNRCFSWSTEDAEFSGAIDCALLFRLLIVLLRLEIFLHFFVVVLYLLLALRDYIYAVLTLSFFSVSIVFLSISNWKSQLLVDPDIPKLSFFGRIVLFFIGVLIKFRSLLLRDMVLISLELDYYFVMRLLPFVVWLMVFYIDPGLLLNFVYAYFISAQILFWSLAELVVGDSFLELN